jgi:hypothetical protein
MHTIDGIDAAKAMNIGNIVNEVRNEVMRATKMYDSLNTPHEADSVIREEYEEFWDEVKRFNMRKGRDTRPQMREELIQLAAMAVRAITDVIDFGREDGKPNGHIDQAPVHAPDQTGKQ